jgi:hypothetical protein
MECDDDIICGSEFLSDIPFQLGIGTGGIPYDRGAPGFWLDFLYELKTLCCGLRRRCDKSRQITVRSREARY